MDPDLEAAPRELRLDDGRTLAWQVYGAGGGVPLYFFHGFPGTHVQAAWVHEPAAAAGVQVVAMDRPGFGGSSPLAGRSIAGFALDVIQLADHLGHRRFGVLGVSCGGPYALATALAWPARVSWAGSMAGIGAMHRPELRRGQLPLLRLMFSLARVHPVLASPLLALDALMFRSNPERAVRMLAGMLTEPDRRLLDGNAMARRVFSISLAQAYRQGLGGAIQEVRLIATYRAERLATLQQPVFVAQSGRDRHVPRAMGRHLMQQLPHGHLCEYADEGHLSVVVHAFADLASSFLHEHARGPGH